MYGPPKHPPVMVDFLPEDMTSVLSWLILEELDILVFSAADPDG